MFHQHHPHTRFSNKILLPFLNSYKLPERPCTFPCAAFPNPVLSHIFFSSSVNHNSCCHGTYQCKHCPEYRCIAVIGLCACYRRCIRRCCCNSNYCGFRSRRRTSGMFMFLLGSILLIRCCVLRILIVLVLIS